MGRYVSVQAYGDNNPKVIQVPYEQAAGGQKDDGSSAGATKPARNKVEKVENIMGSTAGAGSGDFHTYRAHRRTEITRIVELERKSQLEEEEEEFHKSVERKRKECEDRTRKLAEKRRRKKQKKAERKKQQQGGGKSDGDVDDEEEEDQEEDGVAGEEKRKMQEQKLLEAAPVVVKNDGSFLEMMKSLADGKER